MNTHTAKLEKHLIDCGYSIEKINDDWVLLDSESGGIILSNKRKGELISEASSLFSI